LNREPVPTFAVIAAQAADDKLADNTVILEMRDQIGVVDAFVIASGRNSRHVATIVDEVEKKIKDAGGPGPLSVEGKREATWVLMDYGDFIVHVFDEPTRDYYDLEHLWSGAPRSNWQLAEARSVTSA
jgi:ribosome-associated protein